MAVPEPLVSPLGVKVFSLVWDNSGTNASALWQSYFKTVLNGSDVGHAGVYVISGTPKTGYAVTTAGTAFQLPSLVCDGVVIKADPDNSEDIWVGASTVTTTKATTDGYRLAAGESIGIACRQLNTVYIRRGGSVNQGIYYSAQGAS